MAGRESCPSGPGDPDLKPNSGTHWPLGPAPNPSQARFLTQASRADYTCQAHPCLEALRLPGKLGALRTL